MTCVEMHTALYLAASLHPQLPLHVSSANQLQNLILTKYILISKTTQSLEAAICTLSENKADVDNINKHELLIQLEIE